MAPSFANLWRTTEDISPTWASVCSIIDQQEPLAFYSRVGSWNDPDMLEVGNGELGDEAGSTEAAIGRCRAHLAMWAKPMTTGALAVVVLNRGPEPSSVRLSDDTLSSLRAVPGLTVPSIGPVDVEVAVRGAASAGLTTPV